VSDMNIQKLERRLVEEGCSRSHYSIGFRDSDVFCLIKIDGMWKVFYTERGLDQEVMFESASEEEACEFFFKYQTERIEHHHIVGFFKSQVKADALEAQLKGHGLRTLQNPVPYHGWADPRYRVFVVGKDIFKTRELFGDVPLKDSNY